MMLNEMPGVAPGFSKIKQFVLVYVTPPREFNGSVNIPVVLLSADS